MNASTLIAADFAEARDELRWWTHGQAKAIVTRCKPGEYSLQIVPRAAWDEWQYAGLTYAAANRLTRLEKLREEAVAQAFGQTFKECLAAGETAVRAYLAFDDEVKGIHQVLRDAFAARTADRVKRFTPVGDGV